MNMPVLLWRLMEIRLKWGTTYPPVDMIEHDIRMGNAYVCERKQSRYCLFFTMHLENDVTYTTIYDGNWLNDAPYGVVHRIASDGTVKGAASFCLSWAFSQCHNLKIDTHQDNLVMQSLLAKLDFKKMRNHPDRRWIKPNCLSETGQQINLSS